MHDKMMHQIVLGINGVVAAYVPAVQDSLFKIQFVPVHTVGTDFKPPFGFTTSNDVAADDALYNSRATVYLDSNNLIYSL